MDDLVLSQLKEDLAEIALKEKEHIDDMTRQGVQRLRIAASHILAFMHKHYAEDPRQPTCREGYDCHLGKTEPEFLKVRLNESNTMVVCPHHLAKLPKSLVITHLAEEGAGLNRCTVTYEQPRF